jgi:hypothetical protein
MRRVMVMMVGIVAMFGLLFGPPPSEAADSCSLSGTYAVNGLGEAAGFLEAVGTLTFTPNPACTGGTVGGAITLRHQGQPPATFTPAGTYSVTSAGAVTLTLPGVIDLVGVLSLEGGGTTANSLHLAAAFTAPQVFSVTGTRTPPLVGPPDLTCPPDAVRSGSTCIDTYEASVWQTHNVNVIAKIKAGTVTLADLTAVGATQRGASGADYGAGCPPSGNGCKNFYAVSIPGVPPSAFITWFQAAAAARNAGKRLPSNAEWQAAALGTPEPGGSPGAEDCNTSSGGLDLTGARATCVSDVGAFDMVGNLYEWVADWVPQSTACVPALFAGDDNCLAGASTTSGPGALIRGGFFLDGSAAGVFAVNGGVSPSSSNDGLGFRAAR